MYSRFQFRIMDDCHNSNAMKVTYYKAIKNKNPLKGEIAGQRNPGGKSGLASGILSQNYRGDSRAEVDHI